MTSTQYTIHHSKLRIKNLKLISRKTRNLQQEKMNLKLFTKIPTTALVLLAALALFLAPAQGNAQDQGRQLYMSQQFRLGERIIRVAEPGELSDTLNVWGDVNSPGRYLVPRNTTLPQLISYAFGPQTIRSRESELDWSKMRVEVSISQYDEQKGMDEIKNFRYRFNEPLPPGMRQFDLENDQVVAIQVKRRPAFIDYVRVVAPVISSVATTFLIIDRLR